MLLLHPILSLACFTVYYVNTLKVDHIGQLLAFSNLETTPEELSKARKEKVMEQTALYIFPSANSFTCKPVDMSLEAIERYERPFGVATEWSVQKSCC
jgi:hypothetical protein